MLKAFSSGLVIDPETVVAITKGLVLVQWTYPAGTKDVREKTERTAKEAFFTIGCESILYPVEPGSCQSEFGSKALTERPCNVTVRTASGELHNIPMSNDNLVDLVRYMVANRMCVPAPQETPP